MSLAHEHFVTPSRIHEQHEESHRLAYAAAALVSAFATAVMLRSEVDHKIKYPSAAAGVGLFALSCFGVAVGNNRFIDEAIY